MHEARFFYDQLTESTFRKAGKPMAQTAPQVFSSITPAQFAKLSEKAKGAGIDLNGNAGSASKFGVEVAWNYSPEKQELILQCLSAPFFLSSEQVNEKLRALVKESLT